MLLKRGVFAGALFAGALFGAAETPAAQVPPQTLGGGHYVSAHDTVDLELQNAEDAELMQLTAMVVTYLITEDLL